jgi:hypothetical protein
VVERSEQPTEVRLPETRGQGWSWLFGKPRSTDDLYRDPALLFQAAHLVGAASIVAHWLATREDEESKQMGARLAEACGWFYADAKPERR